MALAHASGAYASTCGLALSSLQKLGVNVVWCHSCNDRQIHAGKVAALMDVHVSIHTQKTIVSLIVALTVSCRVSHIYMQHLTGEESAESCLSSSVPCVLILPVAFSDDLKTTLRDWYVCTYVHILCVCYGSVCAVVYSFCK